MAAEVENLKKRNIDLEKELHELRRRAQDLQIRVNCCQNFQINVPILLSSLEILI